MPEGQDPQQNSTQQPGGGGEPPAGAQNTGTPPQPPQEPQQSQGQQPGQPPAAEPEQTVPYARFKEVNDALKEIRDWKAEQERVKREAEEAEAKKRGEFEKLLSDEKDAHATTMTELRRIQIGVALRDYLAADEKRLPYLGRAKYIMPFIEVGGEADQDAIAQAVKAAADQWITDNPIVSGTPGAPANRPTRGATQDITDEERRKQSYRTRM